MTRLFLAASVAALAIAAPAAAGPGGGHGHGGGGGGGGGPHAEAPHGGGGGGGGQHAFGGPHGGGGGGGGPHMFAAPRGGGGGGQRAFAAPRMERQAFAPRVERQQRVQMREQARGNFAGRQQMRIDRNQQQARFAQREQMRANRQQAKARMAERQQMRANREQAQNLRAQRFQQAQNMRAQRMQQAQERMAQRQQGFNRQQAFNQQAFNRQQQIQNELAQRQQLQANRFANVNERGNHGVGFGVGGCPPGLVSKGCMPPGLAAQAFAPTAVDQRVAAIRTLGDARFAPLDFAPQRQILDPFVASALVGMPVATAASFGTFQPFPADLSYLYPSTPNYYYQYGNGYAYQIDRSNNLIDALIPLLAGGYLPGSYLPQSYMSSYVPDYYGLNSFYPSSYDYGYGYDNGYNNPYYNNVCNRYANGVVYQVDCATGMVENVIPTYAGGYGVGQMLPSAYNYYNVPMQYRDLYYPTADTSYWYAPGAIYQYDPSSSLITSVAALMSPGLTIGQPLPAGYDVYNVPYGYRSTYYDTPNAWYRYNNGYIYQVDPTTQLVTAIVASLLS